jgi:FkbM family methyltransferase
VHGASSQRKPLATWNWRLREIVRRKAPRLLELYQRHGARFVAADTRHPRFSRWAREGVVLVRELGSAAVSFEQSGVWVRDADGLEWLYRPGAWLSALGKELGERYEGAEVAYACEALRDGGVFVDVGANVGGFVLPIAARTTAAIHAFEPVPLTCEVLQRNLERNGLGGRVTIWPVAVGAQAGREVVTTARGGDNHLLPAGSQTREPTAPVDVVTLDATLLDQAERVTLIKLDVQGAELPALRGARALLERDAPTLIVEIDLRVLKRAAYPPDELIGFLAELGYERQRFGESGPLPRSDRSLTPTGNYLFTRT